MGPRLAPIAFMCFHFMFWFICHCSAVAAYYNETYHTAIVVFIALVAIHNGGGYYVRHLEYIEEGQKKA